MMYITTTDGKLMEWHVGEPSPTSPYIYGGFKYFPNVICVQADGDELDFINTSFTNLRTRQNKRVVHFFGDDAKTIVGHLD